MPHRLYRQVRPGQKETNIFLLQVYAGDPNLSSTIRLAQKSFLNGTPENPNADELNQYKEEVSKAHGFTMNQTSCRSVNVWQDDEGKLFYYEWDDAKGNVKTMLDKGMGGMRGWLNINIRLS